MHRLPRIILLPFLVYVAIWASLASGESGYILDPTTAGKATAQVRDDQFSVANHLLQARWSLKGHKFSGVSVLLRNGESLGLPENAFSLIMRDGRRIAASEMEISDGPRVIPVGSNRDAVRAADRITGQAIELKLSDDQKRFLITWRAVIHDSSNYFRQEVSISSSQDEQPIQEVRLFEASLTAAKVVGKVKGSPVTAGSFFVGFEHPLSECSVGKATVCEIRRELPLQARQTVTYSLVIGVAEPEQMRRSFLMYLERERARPYRPFLHYNSWYDIGFGKPYDAADVLDVIHAFGRELVRDRGVKLDSFLLDDGWDDVNSLWHMNRGFPDGMKPLTDAAKEIGAGMGIWMSPWGGYEQAKEARLKFGRAHGFETNAKGFALSGPKYYARFREVSRNFIEQDAVNQFKIDGTGNVNSVFPGSSFDSDFAAAINLIQEWRTLKPDLYVNLTTGTYPSPFWLQIADSIWRSGEDHSFAGVGSWREKWITYRDQATYHGVVQAGPLFPLNSLMLHGLIYAKQAEHLTDDPQSDFSNEVHAYFGGGTQLQEMYISHSLLSGKDWDTLAEAARWSRENATVLRDTHWVGGDPAKLQVYGWAGWSRDKSVLTLRNPSNKPQRITLDVGRALELPVGAATEFVAKSPWKQDVDRSPINLSAGKSHNFSLAPFEVLNLELTAAK